MLNTKQNKILGSQVHQAPGPEVFSSLALLRCPKCESEHLLEDKQQFTISCQNCQQNYPLLNFGNISIPFLFSNVDVAIYDWKARINGFSKKVTEEIAALSSEVANKSISKITRERLKATLKYKKEYKLQILNHLSCFTHLHVDETAIANIEIAKNQGVDSYINNIFRDWSWDNGENEEMLSCINEILDDDYNAGQSVTLGAGASRLSYDFHKKYNAKHSVLLDINPVLLGYAKRLLNRDEVELNEFPIAPLSSAEYCIQHSLTAKEISDEFTFLLADGLNAPLKSKAYDSVLTPWFVDIIPVDFKRLIPHVNRLLKNGGVWVNTGSLAFFHKQQEWNYSQEEVVDLLKKFGFSNIRVNRKKINYLHSPYSAHGRVENVFSFSAVKKFDSIPAKKTDYLPEWLENINVAIPQNANIVAVSSKYLLQAQVLSAVDGQRSVIDIGCLLAKQYDMPEKQAIAAVRQIFIENN